MQITLNGKPHEINADTLTIHGLLDTLPLAGIPVLVEHNGTALLAREFEETPVQEGDTLEIIRMVAGG
jgi:sulfur carrier protein